MIDSVKFDSLPGFSKLFLMYIGKNPVMKSRLKYFKEFDVSQPEILDVQSSFSIDPELLKIIPSFLTSKQISEEQTKNLNLLSQPDIFICSTTTKPGFLGGNLANFWKLITVIIYTKKLSIKFPDYNFIPIAWIDDDVLDNFEFSQANVLTKNGDIIEFFPNMKLDREDRTIIHERCFDDGISQIVDDLLNEIPEKNNIKLFINRIKQIYVPEQNWVQSYVNQINDIASSYGMLFISSNKVRKSGLLNNLIAKELTNRSKTSNIIDVAQKEFEFSGLRLKTKAEPYNLNFFKANKVYKCEKREQIKFTEYSPNVILKPVFFDSLLPVVIRVCSPSEIGYMALLRDVYAYFEVEQPIVVSRFSATFIDKKRYDYVKENDLGLNSIIENNEKYHRLFHLYNELKYTINYIYPNHTLQERIFSLVNFPELYKKMTFEKIYETFLELKPNKHYIISF